MKILAGALAFVLAVPGAALAQSASPQPSASGATGGGVVTLVPAGKKSPAGSALLSQQGDNLTVTLQLPQAYQSSGKAMIAAGTCNPSGTAATTNDTTTYQLTVGTKSGPSMTTLHSVSLQSLLASPHVIIVQGTPSLCGDMSTLLPPQKP